MSKLVYIEKPWEDSDYEYGLVPATEADLLELGYVKLNPDVFVRLQDLVQQLGFIKVDDDTIRRIVEAVDMCFEPSINEREDGAAWLDQIEAAVRHELLGGTK